MMIMMLAVVSCSSPKYTEFDLYGVSFTHPDSWQVTEAVDMGMAVYVSVEDVNAKTGGVVTFTIINELMDLDECIAYMGGYFAEIALEEGVEIGDVRDDSYNRYPAKTQTYSLEIEDVKIKGRLIAFNADGCSVCVLEQSFLDGAGKATDVFWKIEDTFDYENSFGNLFDEDIEEFFIE